MEKLVSWCDGTVVLEDTGMGYDCCCNWIPFDYIFIGWNSLTKAATSFLRSIPVSSFSYSVLPLP